MPEAAQIHLLQYAMEKDETLQKKALNKEAFKKYFVLVSLLQIVCKVQALHLKLKPGLKNEKQRGKTKTHASTQNSNDL